MKHKQFLKGTVVRLSEELFGILKVAAPDPKCAFCERPLAVLDEVRRVKVATIHGKGGGDLFVLQCAPCKASMTATLSAETLRKLLAGNAPFPMPDAESDVDESAAVDPKTKSKPQRRIMSRASAGCFLVDGVFRS